MIETPKKIKEKGIDSQNSLKLKHSAVEYASKIFRLLIRNH